MESALLFLGIFLAGSQLLVAVYLLFFEKRITRKLSDIAADPMLTWGRDRGEKVLHDAIKKSQAMMGEAELESVKISSLAGQRASRLETEYENDMRVATEDLQKALLSESAKATMEFKKYLQELKEEGKGQRDELTQITKEKIDASLVDFETKLHSSLTETSEKALTAVETEVAAAKGEIAKYKEERIAKVDAEIVEVLEKTMELVMNKRLTLADHLDLVMESLEEAKKDKFI